jgi:DNA-binding winged helix-turn-helix (wHTH) protein
LFLTAQVIAAVQLLRCYPLVNCFWIGLAVGYTGPKDMSELLPARRYRFGAFEADAATGELRRQGILIRLTAQPFQVLLMLLERPGQLLTRVEISRELWPDGTFVDYEHGVNSAVNRIREALGDSAGNSRFVQTLARRGYRFVAPVERITPGESPPAETAASEVTSTREQEEKELVPASAPTGGKRFGTILATPEDFPKVSYPVVQTLFVLMQLMYLAFYVGALANLAEISDLLSPLSKATQAMTALVVTAAILIPVRAFVLCASLFRAPGVREKFLKLWPFLLVLDVLWSLSPFLLLHHINFGLALACTTLLVYSPFAQRSLVLMGAGGSADEIAASLR